MRPGKVSAKATVKKTEGKHPAPMFPCGWRGSLPVSPLLKGRKLEELKLTEFKQESMQNNFGSAEGKKPIVLLALIGLGKSNTRDAYLGFSFTMLYLVMSTQSRATHIQRQEKNTFYRAREIIGG